MLAPLNEYYTDEEYEFALCQMYRMMERNRIYTMAAVILKEKNSLQTDYKEKVRESAEETKVASKMDAFLQKGQHSYQDGEQFYRSLQQLMEDSQFACRRREDELQYQEDLLNRDYRKKQDELERTIGDLRRSYARTIK